MGLISYDQLEDDVDATANLFNERFAKIYNEFNGNITAANLFNGAVTTPKIADGAVTSAKLNLNYSIDDNGWQVFDFGPFKRYVRSVVTSPGGTRNFDDIPYPVGVSRDEVKEVAPTLIATADDGTGDWGRCWVSCRLNADDIQGFQKMANESHVFPTGLFQIVIVA